MADLSTRKYVRYDSGVSKVPETEAQDIEVVKQAFMGLIGADFAAFKHAFPVSHARTLGVVKGKLIVSNDLPPHLKQSLFSKAGEYPIAMRFNTQNHLVASPDFETQFRGAALKIFNVKGERFPEGKNCRTQDFNFNSSNSEHDLSDAKTAREIIMLRIGGVKDLAGMQKAIDARPDAALQNARLHAPMSHVESLALYSQVPYRFGKYVAKHGLFPSTDTQKKLSEERVPKDSRDSSIVTNWLAEYFAQNEAVYEWRFQLCEDIEEQPIEFAGTKWDPEKYPYQTVAKIVIPKQNSMDLELKTFWEDHVRMDSWRGLKTFEPLGGANRVRRAVYPLARREREKYNGRKAVEVKKITDLPGALPKGVPGNRYSMLKAIREYFAAM